MKKVYLILLLLGLGWHVSAQDDLDRLFEEDVEENEPPPGAFQPPPDAGIPQAPEQDYSPPPSEGPSRFSRPTAPSRPSVSRPAPVVTQSRDGGSGKKVSLADAQPEDITNENFPELIDSFDYPNADIAEVVSAISKLTKKNFIIDKDVHGKISIVAPTQITVAEAYKAFLSALAMNNFTVVPSGKFLKIKQARAAQRDSIETYSGAYYPTSDMMITRIVHLKHISAEEVNKRLLRILPSTNGEFTTYEPTNSIIITDFGSNVDRIMKILNQLDRPGFEDQLEVIPIRYAKAKELAELIMKIITKGQGGSSNQPGGFAPPFSRFPRGSGSGAAEELSMVSPDDRTNALIVMGNKAGIQKVRGLVAKLDFKLDPAESGGVFVYYVKFGEAEKIAQTLSGLAQSATSQPAAQPGSPNRPFGSERQAVFGGDVKVTSDKLTNSLVISASKQDYEIVQSLISKLDIPRDQVYVEAIIMEMNSNKSKDWNVSSYYLDTASKGVGRFGYQLRDGTLNNFLSPQNGSDKGAILGFGGGEKFKMKIAGGTEIEIPNILSLINFIQSQVEGNILSNPQILAMDNEEAIIEVGDKLPIGADTTTGTAGQQTVSPKFEDVSIKLTLTPFIRPDSNAVRMKLTQIVKQKSKNLVDSTTLAAATTSISNRSIQTNITVNDGDTAVLGGLMKDEDSVDEQKVPLLGDIPVLGWLFKSSKRTKNKVNLLVFLTPKIIRNKEDSQKLVDQKKAERIEWIKDSMDGRDPYGKTLEKLPRSSAVDTRDTGAKKQ